LYGFVLTTTTNKDFQKLQLIGSQILEGAKLELALQGAMAVVTFQTSYKHLVLAHWATPTNLIFWVGHSKDSLKNLLCF
jgi:hypothetical protein